MNTDWLGIIVTILVIVFIILMVWAKVQGDRVIDILEQIKDFIKGDE